MTYAKADVRINMADHHSIHNESSASDYHDYNVGSDDSDSVCTGSSHEYVVFRKDDGENSSVSSDDEFGMSPYMYKPPRQDEREAEQAASDNGS